MGIGERSASLPSAGFFSLNAQAKVFGLPCHARQTTLRNVALDDCSAVETTICPRNSVAAGTKGAAKCYVATTERGGHNAKLERALLRDLACKCEGTTVVQIREIGEALTTASIKGTGLSARIICRMLSSGELPVLVSGENHGIRGGKSSQYLRWDGEAAPQVHREAHITGATVHVFTTW